MNKKKLILLIISILFLAASLFLKFNSKNIVLHLYDSGDFKVLNLLSHSTVNNPFDFYLGKFDELYFGPLFITITGIAFLMICMTFLKSSSPKIFFAAIFSYLIFTRFEVLFYPPYGDAAGGLFVEAVWLLRHGFDYVSLAKQPIFIAGGPKVYLFSIFPSALAFLMKVASTPKIFLLITHIIVFVLGSLTVVLFRGILRKVANKEIAMLAALSLLTFPLFQSQVEMINMEMTATFFAVSSMYFLTRKRLPLASLMSVLSMMVKGIAIYVCATVFFVSIFIFLFDAKLKFRKHVLFWGLFSLSFLAFVTFVTLKFVNYEGNVELVGLFSGWGWMKYFRMLNIYIYSLIIFIGLFIKQRFFHKNKEKRNFAYFFNHHFTGFVMFICAGGWFALFLNSAADSARYFLIGIPFFIFFVFYIVCRLCPYKKVIKLSLVVLILLSLVGSYGLFNHKTHKKMALLTDHLVLEGSLKYRNDIKVYIQIAKELISKYKNYTIGAPHIITQLLVFPELGLVDKKFKIITYGYPCLYEGIESFKGLNKMDISKTVWVGYDADFGKGFRSKLKYPVSKYDKLLKEVICGDRHAYLFMGGAAIEEMRLIQNFVLLWLANKGKLKDRHKINFGM